MRELFLDSHESHSSIQHDGQYGEWGSEHWSLALVHEGLDHGAWSMGHGAFGGPGRRDVPRYLGSYKSASDMFGQVLAP